MSGFERVAVLGLGLLGGSVALAARERRAAARVVGSSRRAEVREEALARGVVDAAGDAEEVVVGADLVILATPITAMEATLRAVGGSLAAGAIVTDVGSVKGPLQDRLPGLLPRGVRYVGSHPMAGSHQSGLEHARADLLEGAPCVVLSEAEADARERVCAFWRRLGARVVVRSAATHDAEVAWISHLPHALAFAFADALGEAPAGAAEVAGSGFRDFTRIARSEPELWTDILAANRKALSGPLAGVARSLAKLAEAIESEDVDALDRAIHRARENLFPASRDGHGNAPQASDPAVRGTGDRQGKPETST